MADSTVSALSAASALSGAELLYGVQGGGDRKITATQIRQFAGPVYNAQDYGWLPDGTDRASQALALLATVSAAGGGTIFFPASTTAYRCDSQLFIPNDGYSAADTGPNQFSIAFVGAAGGVMWDATRTLVDQGQLSSKVGAATLDLRYTAVNGNAKIETRGTGSLSIENLTITDGGAPNATPFVHTTNTTLLIRGNVFVGSGSAAQDAIVLGCPVTQVESGGVDSPFQGYGTIIDGNSFLKLNRGVYGRTYANSVIVTNNVWHHSTGDRAIEFAATTGDGPDIITGLVVTGNIIEMKAPMAYGIVLRCVQNSYFVNSFYDHAGNPNYVSDHLYVAGTISFCSGNIILELISINGVRITQTGQIAQLSNSGYIGCSGNANPYNDGIASSYFAKAVEIAGHWVPANKAAGVLNLRFEYEPSQILCFAPTDTGQHYIDAYNTAGFWQGLGLNPRGGWVQCWGPLALKPTALTLSNGLNSDIQLFDQTPANKSSFIRVNGPSAGFSLGGFFNKAGSGVVPGSLLTIYNSTSQPMTIVNESASSATSHRIRTLTGSNVVLRAGTSSASLIYDDTDLRWILTASN